MEILVSEHSSEANTSDSGVDSDSGLSNESYHHATELRLFLWQYPFPEAYSYHFVSSLRQLRESAQLPSTGQFYFENGAKVLSGAHIRDNDVLWFVQVTPAFPHLHILSAPCCLTYYPGE